MAELFSILTKDKVSGTAIDIGETFETILSLTTPNRPAGSYQVEVSFVPNFPSAIRSFDWQVIGDTPSPVYSHENSDDTNYEPFFYGFSIDHQGGIFNIDLQARKETATPQLDFDVINLAFRRIG